MAKKNGRIIDGNAIVSNNKRKREAVPQGYGEFTNPQTGEVITSAFSKPTSTLPMPTVIRQQQQQPSQQQMQADAYDDMEREAFYADEASGGGSGMVGINKYGSPIDANGDTPMEYMSPQEIEDTRMEYATSLGNYSNFAEENGINMNDMFNRFSEEYSDEDIALFKDARKIKNFDDAVKVGMMNDEMADIMNLDTEKYFGEDSIMELCGRECQQKRLNQHQHRDRNHDRSENILAMDDEEFLKQDRGL